MKILILTRHAKSDWGNPLLKDKDRTLNERGIHNAPMMGERLQQRGYKVDLIVASDAVRTTQTAQLIAPEINYPISDIKWEERLYHASPMVMADVIKQTNNKHQTVMVVAHNPGITELVNSFGIAVTNNMATCGIAAFEFETDNWNEFDTAAAKLLFYDYPKKV